MPDNALVYSVTGELEFDQRQFFGESRLTLIPLYHHSTTWESLSARSPAVIAVSPKLSSAKAVIAEQKVQRVIIAHRHPLPASVVVFDHRARAAGPLEVDTDGVGGHAAQHEFDAGVVPPYSRTDNGSDGMDFISSTKSCAFLGTPKTYR